MMSDTTNMQNTTQNTNGTNNKGNGNGAPAPAQPKKDNIFMAGLKRAGAAVSNGWKAVKASPWTHALFAFGGTVGGGYLGYKLAESMRPTIPAVPDPVPQIPEPQKDDEQTENHVEYVDIPKDEPVTEDQ
jgi:hypothetical protein